MMFSRTWTSVAPLTSMRAFQKSFFALGSTSVLAAVWMPSKRPTTGDHAGLVTPDGGVARARPTHSGVTAARASAVAARASMRRMVSSGGSAVHGARADDGADPRRGEPDQPEHGGDPDADDGPGDPVE